MVHRDPETGQFLAHDDDEPLELTYADHEFVNFGVGAVDTDGPGESEFVEFHIDDEVLDLENDELGMLTWMTGRLTVAAEFDPDGEDAGYSIAEAVIGSNLAGSEYLNSPGSDGGVQVISETDGTFGSGVANDEAGCWAVLSAVTNPAFLVGGTGAAGGAALNGDRLVRVYEEETRGGPYIDATDDITIGISISTTRSEDNVRAKVNGQMSFLVFEYETRRAEFAPYDPGPSM